ncbi:MAG: carbohydrate kinase [Deltaproteobacteria bacterium]|nr:carbohydrate kinase [Deltaproteobacteria bacterium]
MQICFAGHLSIDVNVVKGVAHTTCGGGVFYGAIAAHRLGARTTVYTKCAAADQSKFAELAAAGVPVTFLPSATSTSIRNDYPTDNPDDRTSHLISRGAPFSAADLEAIQADVLHVNPLWRGEFPPDLLPLARQRTEFLAADAQGFLRRAADDPGKSPTGDDKTMVYRDWDDKRRYLPLLDLFKVDAKEARILTGSDDPRAAARQLRALGARTVLLTHQAGVLVHDGREFFEAPFAAYAIEGRTGRGDTCTAAFLVARATMPLAAATAFAARVTSEKMQYRGPYRPAT